MRKQSISARRAAKTAKAEAKKAARAKAKAEEEAKHATAKAELEAIGKQIATRVKIMRDSRKAAASEPEPCDAATTPLTKEEISDNALTAAKEYWLKEIASKISEDDYRKYKLFISDESQCMPRGWRKEAA